MQRLPSPTLAAPPSASGLVTRLAVARATAAGVDPGPLLRKAGLIASQIQDRQARVDAAKQITFLNLVADALPDELLGFHLAEAFELREVGLLFFVLASSATLDEAFARAERYSTITNEGIRLQRREGSSLSLRYSYVGLSRHTDRHQVEFLARTLVRICQNLTGKNIKPIRVSIAHPCCGSSDQLDAFFGCKVAFAAEHDEIAFARDASQLRLVRADPYLNELLVRYCEEVLSRRANPAIAIRTSVENAIAPLEPRTGNRTLQLLRELEL